LKKANTFTKNGQYICNAIVFAFESLISEIKTHV
jgi:hypothetical protein